MYDMWKLAVKDLLETLVPFISSGLFSFLGCFGLHVLLEFGLLKKEKCKPALAAGLAISALICDLISFVNQRIYSWPNLGAMTLDLTRMYFVRCKSLQVMEVLTIWCLLGSIGALLSMLITKDEQSKEKTS